MKHLRKINAISILEFSTEFVIIWLGIKIGLNLIQIL